MLKKILFSIHKNIEKDLHELRYLFFEITSKCNLNCLHCGSDCSSYNSPKELTKDEWINFINYLSINFDPKSITIVITGGEPLMYENIIEIGSYITKKGFRWGIVSNGYLLDELKYNTLIDSGIKYATISLDGLEDSHNYLRNINTGYEKVINAIKLINSSKNLTDVVTCVYEKNLSQLDAVADLLISLKVKRWRLFSIISKGRASENNHLQLNKTQWKNLIKWISENKKKYAKKGLNINFSCEGYFKEKVDQKIRDFPFFCRAGVNISGILNDGSIAVTNRIILLKMTYFNRIILL